MMRMLGRLAQVGSSVLLSCTAALAQAPVPPAAAPAEQLSPADREMQQLMQQLTNLGENIVRNVQSPNVWQLQVQQGDLMLQIAFRSPAKERDNWVRMAIDSYHSGAVQAPTNERSAYDRLAQLPAYIGQHFPGSQLHSYAALQRVRTDHTLLLGKEGMDAKKAQEHLRQSLLRFAQAYPKAPEAPGAIVESAKISESLGRKDEACQCYRYLAEHHAGTAVARQARASLRRLGGMIGEAVELRLPTLYASAEHDGRPFDLRELQSQNIAVFFWSTESAGVAEGFAALKRVTDRYPRTSIDVVYVNVDEDPAKAKSFLAGQLFSGVHLHLKDGLKDPLAERYGLDSLPQMLLVSRDGKLIQHSTSPAQIEAVIGDHLPVPGRRGR